MRESLWGYWIVVLGVFVIVIMMLISNVTTTNTQDYYLIKEVTEQAMVDAVDLGYYRTSRELKINADKFVESFLRRFAENVVLSSYKIEFYGIYEAPPKVSVKVTTTSNSFMIGTSTDSFDIVNKVDAILELDGVVSSENIDVVTGITGGNNGDGSSNDGTSAIPGGGQTEDPKAEDYAPNVKDLEEIMNNYPEDFYTVKTGAINDWNKKGKTQFLNAAIEHFEVLTGRALTAEQKKTLENVVNRYYNNYTNNITTRPGVKPTIEQMRKQSSSSSSSGSSSSSSSSNMKSDDYLPRIKEGEDFFVANTCDFLEEGHSVQKDDDHHYYPLKDFESFKEQLREFFESEDGMDHMLVMEEVDALEEVAQKLYDKYKTQAEKSYSDKKSEDGSGVFSKCR